MFQKFPRLSLLFFTAVILNFSCSKSDKNEAQSTSGITAAPDTTAKKTILFLGNSLSAGYGLENEDESFPSRIQQIVDSLGLPYEVVNAGNSGETTAGGVARIDWVLKNKVDVFVLELGGNDGLRGVAAGESEKNLQQIIDRVKATYPQTPIILAGMQSPPNMGAKYTGEFKAIYPRLAQKNNILLIPFLLEGVGGEEKYNQKDGIHPNAAGARILAANVWAVLKDVL